VENRVTPSTRSTEVPVAAPRAVNPSTRGSLAEGTCIRNSGGAGTNILSDRLVGDPCQDILQVNNSHEDKTGGGKVLAFVRAAGRGRTGRLDRPIESSARLEREKAFWDHAVRGLEVHAKEYRLGPEANTRMMMQAIRPRPGLKVLDFACGVGLTSCWLASTGCDVTGIDLSPSAIDAARELADALQVNPHFKVGDVESLELPESGFDAIIGRYALHHLDVEAMAPVLARCLAPDGIGVFLENMAFNPVLRFAREHAVGRFGIVRYGDDDEHPLNQADLAALERSFGTVGLTQAEYRFLLMFDRQVLHGRSPAYTRVARRIDQLLGHIPATKRWSYSQLVVVSRRRVPRQQLLRRVVDAPCVLAAPDDPSDDHRRM
jgi:ubiquinone/menaquinone biosynthesis C-methylase UbiE